jgi:hypothetical protein
MEEQTMTSEKRDPPERSSGGQADSTLIEHSSTGGRFTRLLGSTFSMEDGFTLKHVAAVIVILLLVVMVFGLISLMA